MYIVSRCLLGHDCKYNGGNNKNDEVIEFCKTHDYVTICPETEGGLESPRPPAEIIKQGGELVRVVNKEGNDVTRQFTEGAEKSLRIAMAELTAFGDDAHIEGAVLKANSPSCGSGIIYDGSFTGTKTEGYGIFAELLIKAFEEDRNACECSDPRRFFADGFTIVDENNIHELVNE